MEFIMKPVAFVHNAVGTDKPNWRDAVSQLELDSTRFTEAALDGLDEFSHVDVVFVFHHADEDVKQNVNETHHPHDRSDWPRVGIFGRRSPTRPNRIGVSCCELLSSGAPK